MQKRSEETHARILSAALEVFAQSGYEASGVAEICQAAGVSKGAFYHHFPTKQAVFIELLTNWLDVLDAQMLAVQQQARDVPSALLQMTGLMQGVFQQAGGWLPMFLEFWTQASHDPVIWQAVVAPYRRYIEFFRGMVQQGIQEGTFQPVDAEVAARAIVALAVGLLLQGILDPADANWQQIPGQGIEVLLAGLTKKL